MPFCATYEDWMKAQELPIYRDYFVEDARTLKLAPWKGRDRNAAFLQLVGQEGVVEARVEEIAPGKTTPPLKMGVDESVYILQGNGMCAVWAEDGGAKKNFEWGPHSLFLVPSNSWYQVSNMSGSEPARLLIYSYLPVAIAATTDPEYFINNPYTRHKVLDSSDEFYSQAKAVQEDPNSYRAAGKIEQFWVGNFFPDLKAWDKLTPFRGRGAGGRAVYIHFPNSETTAHMSVFPARTYKKGHRHGPGVVIVIPGGEGYSLMWKEGDQDKIVVPWHEGSIFVPPNKYFHQHFNLAEYPSRYLAFHAPPQLKLSEKIEDIRRDQIEYTQETPDVRQRFEQELKKRGLESQMPDEAYKDPNFEWSYQEAKAG